MQEVTDEAADKVIEETKIPIPTPAMEQQIMKEKEVDKDLDDFYQFIKLKWNPFKVIFHIQSWTSAAPLSLMHPMYWAIPQGLKLDELVYRTMQDFNYVASHYSILKRIVGRNFRNFEVTASLLTTFATIDVLRYGVDSFEQQMNNASPPKNG